MPLLSKVIGTDIHVRGHDFSNELRRGAIEDVIDRKQVACIHADVIAQSTMEVDGFCGAETLLKEGGVVQRDRAEVVGHLAVERQRACGMRFENFLLLRNEVGPQCPGDVQVVFDVGRLVVVEAQEFFDQQRFDVEHVRAQRSRDLVALGAEPQLQGSFQHRLEGVGQRELVNVEDRIAVDQFVGILREHLANQGLGVGIKLALFSDGGQLVEQADDEFAMLTNAFLVFPKMRDGVLHPLNHSLLLVGLPGGDLVDSAGDHAVEAESQSGEHVAQRRLDVLTRAIEKTSHVGQQGVGQWKVNAGRSVNASAQDQKVFCHSFSMKFDVLVTSPTPSTNRTPLVTAPAFLAPDATWWGDFYICG